MSELALSCYESSLCFFNTTSLLSHKFWCLSVNLVQSDLKVFVAVSGRKRERKLDGSHKALFVWLEFTGSKLPPVSHLSFPQTFSCKVFFPTTCK